MTESIQEAFRFADHFSRRVEAGLTAGHVSNDGGGLLLRQVERKINLLERLASCFSRHCVLTKCGLSWLHLGSHET